MKSRSFLVRAVCLGLMMLLISGVLLTQLASIQLVPGGSQQSGERIYTRTYTEATSRGEILDRNGEPLISNQLGFTVEFDYYRWNRQEQNQVILTVCRLLEEKGYYSVESDSLPVAVGEKTVTFTEDVTGNKALNAYVEDKKDWPPLSELDARGLLELMCENYGISDELSLAERRLVAGVRYDMERRQFSAYNNPFTLVSGIDVETVSRLSELTLSLPGVQVGVDDMRQFSTTYMAHILGRTGKIINYDDYKDLGYAMNAIVGNSGAEKAFESYLRGIDGTLVVEANAEGRTLGQYYSKEPQPGDNIYLTIDLGMQKVAEDALAQTLADIRVKGEAAKDKKGADVEGGAVVVIDVHTGEILAMASYPTYDLSRYSEKGYNASLLEADYAPLFDRAISGVYPPGSTFKVATALAALEEKVITPQTRIRDQGVYRYYAPNYTPACWIWNDRRATHGNINVSDAIKYSCNYFFFETSRQLGITRLNEYAKRLGLGQKTGIELPGEKGGNLAGPESREAKGGGKWNDGETLQAAIGQSEQQFTPLQLCSYIATIVNGGTRYQPHLLRQVTDYTNSEVLERTEPKVLDQIPIAPETLEAIRKGMLGVTTEDGTASSVFRNYPISIGGKTGSAQTSNNRSAHGVFVSFAPYDEPEIAICVIGDYAGSGGNVAPVSRAIYDYYFGIEEPVEAPETENTETGSTPAVETPAHQSDRTEEPAQDAPPADTGAETPPPATGETPDTSEPDGQNGQEPPPEGTVPEGEGTDGGTDGTETGEPPAQP